MNVALKRTRTHLETIAKSRQSANDSNQEVSRPKDAVANLI